MATNEPSNCIADICIHCRQIPPAFQIFTKHVYIDHCEGSLRFGPGFGLGLGLGLGLTFNCVQSLKSRILKTLFLLIFNVFFGRNQQ